MDEFLAQVGRSLGPGYRLERELGPGGMSRVYVATELALEREVVVKVLAPELGAGFSLDRFRREVRVAASLQHPHIVPVLTAGEGEGLRWYTMPLVQGRTLRDLMGRTERPSLRESLAILRDVADALAHAHRHGVVHRDIKPENILLADGHAVVTDFGIAKAVEEGTGHRDITQTGAILGTPAYMSPEQAAGDKEVDHRADIYAWGCIAYELLSGFRVAVGTTSMAVIASHLMETPPPLRERSSSVPPPLAALVDACLAKAPADRPQSGEELLSALARVTEGSGEIRRPRLSRRVLAVLVVAGSLAAAGWALLRDPGPPATRPYLLLAEVDAGGDSVIGPALDVVVRTWLGSSKAFVLVTPERTRTALARMTRPMDAVVTAATARDLAQREGYPLLAATRVSRVGTGYLITGRVSEAVTDRELGSTTESVSSVDSLIPAMEKVAKRLARFAGESAAGVHSQPSLPSVTTRSLPALVRYAKAVEAMDLRSDHVQANALLEEAVALDPEFGMAWNLLAFTRFELAQWEGIRTATSEAYRHRDRMTEFERAYTNSAYASFVDGDPVAAQSWLDVAHEIKPDDWLVLNRMAEAEIFRGDPARAVELLEHMLAIDSTRWAPWGWLTLAHLQLGDTGSARLDLIRARHGTADNPRLWRMEFLYHYTIRDSRAALASAESAWSGPRADVARRARARMSAAIVRARDGQLVAARAQLDQMIRVDPTAYDGTLSIERALQVAEWDAALGHDPVGAHRELARELRQANWEAIPRRTREVTALRAAAALAIVRAPKEAQSLLQRYGPDRPLDHAAYLWAHGWIHLAEGEPDSSIALLQEAAGHPGTRFLNIILTFAWDDLDNAQEADSSIAAGERSLRSVVWPGDEELSTFEQPIRRRLAVLYEAKGDTARAIEHYEAFLERWKDADPDLAPQVAEIRERLALLKKPRG